MVFGLRRGRGGGCRTVNGGGSDLMPLFVSPARALGDARLGGAGSGVKKKKGMRLGLATVETEGRDGGSNMPLDLRQW